MNLEQFFDGISDYVDTRDMPDDHVKNIMMQNALVMGKMADVMLRNLHSESQGLNYGDAKEFSSRLIALAVELASLHDVTAKDVMNYLSDHGYAFPNDVAHVTEEK